MESLFIPRKENEHNTSCCVDTSRWQLAFKADSLIASAFDPTATASLGLAQVKHRHTTQWKIADARRILKIDLLPLPPSLITARKVLSEDDGSTKEEHER